MSNTAATPTPDWLIEFCSDYTPFLFSAGKWTIIAGILLGIAVAAAKVILAFRQPAGGNPALEAAASPALLDAIKGFIQALTSAPTWLALFGGGLLLLWMAGNAVPEICNPAPKGAVNRQAPAGTAPAPQGSNSTGNAAAAATGTAGGR